MDRGSQLLLAWYFTDIQKWSVVAHQGEKCCLLSCLSSVDKDTTTSDQRPPLSSALSAPVLPIAPRITAASSGNVRCESFLLQTSEAGNICDVIDFYVGKCMAKLEVLTIEFLERYAKERRATTVDGDSGVKRIPSANSMLVMAHREVVERSKSERVVSKMMSAGDDGPSVTLAKLYVSAPKVKGTAFTKEHAVRAVSLAPDAPLTLNKTRTSIQVVEASSGPLNNVAAPAEVCSRKEEVDDTPKPREAPSVLDEHSRNLQDESSVNHEPAATIQVETSLQTLELKGSRLDEEPNRTSHSKESVPPPVAEDGSLSLPIELDMIECLLVEDDVDDPEAASCDLLTSSDGSSALCALDLLRDDGNDAEDNEEREPSLFLVDDHDTDVPLLEPASSQTELRLDELDAELIVSTPTFDLASLVTDQREDGAQGDREGDDACDAGEDEEELDRFESFEYCICHVDGAAPSCATTADKQGDHPRA